MYKDGSIFNDEDDYSYESPTSSGPFSKSYYTAPVSGFDLSLRLERVTIDQAIWILDNLNVKHPPVKQKKVEGFMVRMKAGWRATPKCYLGFLGGSGLLCDGQHKLLAQIALNVELDYYFLRGLNPNHYRNTSVIKPNKFGLPLVENS